MHRFVVDETFLAHKSVYDFDTLNFMDHVIVIAVHYTDGIV